MKKYIIFSVLITALLIYNLTTLHLQGLAIILAVIYLIYFGRRLGILALPQLSSFWQRLFGPLLLLAFFSVSGTIVYYLYKLDEYSLAGLIILLPILIIPFARYLKKDIADWSSGLMEPVPMVEPNTGRYNFWWWFVFLSDSVLLWYLFSHGTWEAIRSPWTVISYKFFIAFFVSSLALFIYLKKISGSVRSLGIIFLHSFLLLSVALLIYQSGFGFDPYLHQASEKYIYQNGAIEPKTPYYIGQYVLVVGISKLAQLPIDIVDRWLLVLLESFFLAPLFFLVFRRVFNLERKEAKIGSVLIFLLPFSHLITTTPQGLVNFYAIAGICFSLLYLSEKSLRFFVPLLFILAALATHPLTGIPLFLSFIILFLLKMRQKQNEQPGWQFLIEVFLFLFFIGSLIILPLIFIFFQGATFDKPDLQNLWQGVKPFWPEAIKNHSWKFLPVYIYQALLPYILIVLGFWGGWKYYLKKTKESAVIIFLFFTFAIFISNSFFLRIAILFKDVGMAEQGQYSQRLAQFSFYIILPLAIYGLFILIEKIKSKTKNPELLGWGPLITALLFAFGLTSSFYLSYPRVDAYEMSHYINTSIHDFAAVAKVEEQSQNQPYIVLSNISVSAASIKEYGFKKYYKTPTGEEIFYYALPTGSALYHYFEDMVYKDTSRDTMIKAMNLAGVSQGYLILNDYWDSFKKVLPLAKQTADEWWSINDKVFIFKYKK
ncbi:MAG: hypothetical protein NTU97_03735 [Candidatus Magasanikbacteria bacterium]|nr:hypothetical protein [Candidatus Magasanikbacteria bacterium]